MRPGVRCGGTRAWTGGQTVWHPVRAEGPAGAPGPTPATAVGTRWGRHVTATKRAVRLVGHASGGMHHAQGGWERVRGVVSPRSTPSAVPGGGTSGRPQRARCAATGGWCGRGGGASGCPRVAGHGGGLASPRLGGGLRVVPPGRGRRVAVRPRARPGGPAGGVGGPEAGRRLQRATLAQCAGRAVPLAARRAQRVGCAVSHGRRSGGGPRRRGRGGVRGPASPVAWASCLSVQHTATVNRESGTTWASCLGVGHTGLLPRACAQAQSRKAGRRGATPRAEGRAHAAPNNALEPTPNSLRSCLALAIGRGSPRAFGCCPA